MMKVRHTGIFVKDIKSMIDFYREIFHMEIAVHQIEEGEFISSIYGEQGIRIEVCKLIFPNKSMIELIQFLGDKQYAPERKKLYDLGNMHIAITVEAADDIYGALKKRNCNVLSEPHISVDGKAKVFFAQDLEGNYLEIVEEI